MHKIQTSCLSRSLKCGFHGARERFPKDFGANIRHVDGSGRRDIRSTLAPKWWYFEGKLDRQWWCKLIAFPMVGIRSERKDTSSILAPILYMWMGAGGEISAGLWRQNDDTSKGNSTVMVVQINCLSNGRCKERAERHLSDFGAKMRHVDGNGRRDIRSTLPPK